MVAFVFFHRGNRRYATRGDFRASILPALALIAALYAKAKRKTKFARRRSTTREVARVCDGESNRGHLEGKLGADCSVGRQLAWLIQPVFTYRR
jgi:hypothetical protein